MRRWIAWIALAVLAPAVGLAAGDEPPKPENDPWIGKSRAEIVAKWGKPAKSKTKRGVETLVYEVEVFVGEFYYTKDGGFSTDILPASRDDDGKRQFDVENEGVTQVATYKKLKFKFYLDESGHVTKTDFPDKAKTYTP